MHAELRLVDVTEQAGKRQGFLLFKADLGPRVLRREHLTLGSDRQASGPWLRGEGGLPQDGHVALGPWPRS